jgi:hypothetical protein
MNLPPIPLTDGAFLIDNSSLEKLRCPRAFEYSELWHKVPIAERAGANFGSTIHRGLENRYALLGTNPVDQLTEVLIESVMRQWLDENPQPENEFRNFNHACKMMAVYNNIYKKEEWKILTNQQGKPIIEATFALPFGNVKIGTDIVSTAQGEYNEDVTVPIIYCGKIDLGIEDHNGIWSFDHKTTFQFGDTFDKQMSMDGGQLGYCWALQQVTGKKPQGYIIDAIRVRRPTKKDEFAEKSCIDGTDFKRTPYYVSQDMLDEWKNDVLTLIQNIFAYSANGHFPRHRWNCTNKFGLCDYFDVCSTVINQREQILNSSLFEENKWSKGLKV